MYSVCMRLRCLHPLARALVLKAYMYRFQLLFFFPLFLFKVLMSHVSKLLFFSKCLRYTCWHFFHKQVIKEVSFIFI